MSTQEEVKQSTYFGTAQAYLGAAASKAAELKEAHGPTISEKLGELKIAGYSGAQNAYAAYMARSEVKQPDQTGTANYNRRASIAAPITVQDDDEIEQSVTAKAQAVWGGLMGKFTAATAKPEKQESSGSEEEKKDDKPSGDTEGPPRDSFAGADEAPVDDAADGGAIIPKVGGLEVVRKNLIPKKPEVVEEESKIIVEADALELTPGTLYFGEL